MRSHVTRRPAGLLAAAVVGIYAVAALGTTEAVTSAEAACTTWPTCTGHLLPAASVPSLVAWGHRVSVFLVGLLLAASLVDAFVETRSTRVRSALGVAVLVYVVEVFVGRETFAGKPVTGLHLGLAVVVFVAVLAALAWTLDDVVGDLEHGVDRTSERPATATKTQSAALEPEPERTADADASGRVRQYVSMTKPRLMWLLNLVALAALLLAGGGHVPLDRIIATVVGGCLAIGASGTFNHVIERDRDSRMARTADRPVATDRIPVRNATAFGVALALLSLSVFAVFVNGFAAALALGAILFYSVGYTVVLKPNTTHNIVVGGFAGAFPALIGGAGATGRITLPVALLALVIFAWTPAHFYNLALAYAEDYERGGYPMLSVIRGDRVTRRHIVWYLGATLLSALLLGALTPLGSGYVLTTVAFGAVFLWAVLRLFRERTDRAALRSFHASNLFLAALLLAVAVGVVVA